MSFIPSSAASSATTPSISGASSLLPLLAPSSTLALELAKTPEGGALLAQLISGSGSGSGSLSSPHPSHASPSDEKESLTPGSQRARARADKLPFSTFAQLVRNASRTIRTLPVTAIESYQKGGPDAGLVPHRYSLLTVPHPHPHPHQADRPTYVKLHLRAVEGSFASVLTAELADDRSALVRPCDRRLAALELDLELTAGQAVEGGPSLDALAALLDIIDQRAGGKYDMHGRNCLWLADLILFGCALKFKDHWLAGAGAGAGSEGGRGCRISPGQPIRQYLRGEIDVLAASTQCFLPQGLPWWMGNVYAALGKVFGAFDMQREVEDVVRTWRDFVGAVLPGSLSRRRGLSGNSGWA